RHRTPTIRTRWSSHRQPATSARNGAMNDSLPIRFVPFDGLRGVAILMVFATHASPLVAVGQIGVDIFFTLSGYLITSLLLEERRVVGTIALRRFYLRRFLRLKPALVVA